MESPKPPISLYTPKNSKKRVFPGGSSSGCKDADVIEIPPPVNSSSNSRTSKQKEVICHPIIDVDADDDYDDVVIINDQVDARGKGKEVLSNGSGSLAKDGFRNGSQSSNNGNGTCNSTDVDDFSSALDFNSGLFYGEDEMYYDDLLYDDEYAILQSHFDHMDIPTGVEATVPWLPSFSGNGMKLTGANTSSSLGSQNQLNANLLPPTSSPLASGSFKPVKIKYQSTLRNIPVGSTGPSNLNLNLSSPMGQPAHHQENLITSSGTHALSSHPPSGFQDNISGKKASRVFIKSKRKFNAKGASYYHGPGSQSGSVGSSLDLSMPMNTFKGGAYMPMWNNASMNMWDGIPSGFMNGGSFSSWGQHPAEIQNGTLSAEIPEVATESEPKNLDEILDKLNNFKRFDTVDDCSDHHYYRNCSTKQPPKSWAKKIQEEWKILEKDLPDTIFVRVYESRMDLLRAVIVGAEGTPYHDGLFFFDVFFPAAYPNVPPHVHYHSHGLRINPNLYNCGKVCLSLLNTWSGSQKEKWLPGVSTMLQVLVSIQGLILNANPYFNEPGYANSGGTITGQKASQAYNETTFIYSLRTMVYSMRNPPKYFEELVIGHFCKNARDILVACKAYMQGAQVGCLVKGGVQDVDEGDKSCSSNFKSMLGGFITTLVNNFTKIGAKDCQEFLSLAQNSPQYSYY